MEVLLALALGFALGMVYDRFLLSPAVNYWFAHHVAPRRHMPWHRGR